MTRVEEKDARLREGLARLLCEMGDADPDFRMWDGQPLWKWRMHGSEARTRIEAAMVALKA